MVGASLALLLFVSACASRPPPALTPVSAPSPRASTVDLLVSTTRRPDANPAILFNGERTLRPRFASVTVSIPPNHVPGEISWATSSQPDPETMFAATRAGYLEQDGFTRALRQRIGSTRRGHVLVFVHGYNTRFDEAAFRFAQIVHDSGSAVTPVLFSWPSWGSFASYPYDRTSAAIARDGLESLLASLAQDPAVSEVSVLAHSMGGWLAMEAFRQMGIRKGRISPKIGNLMLAAPDIDVDVAAEQARSFGARPPRISLFVSRDDNALWASNLLWGSRDRLGSIDPTKEPYVTNLARFGVNVIDLTDISPNDSTRHIKFAQSADVVRLIGMRLARGQNLESAPGPIEGVGRLTQGTLNVVGDVLTAPLRIGQPPGPGPAAAASP